MTFKHIKQCIWICCLFWKASILIYHLLGIGECYIDLIGTIEFYFILYTLMFQDKPFPEATCNGLSCVYCGSWDFFTSQAFFSLDWIQSVCCILGSSVCLRRNCSEHSLPIFGVSHIIPLWEFRGFSLYVAFVFSFHGYIGPYCCVKS